MAQQLEKESEDLASAMATKLAEVRRKLEAAQQAKTTSAATVNHRSSPERRDGVHSSIASRGYDSEEDNGGFGYNDSLDDDDDNEYAYHEGGKAEWRSDVRELNQNVSPTREELTRRARSLLQGQEEDMNQTYMQAMKLSTASAAGGKSVPSLSLSGNHADPTPTPFTVTEAPNSARIASARGMGTLSSLTPRGLLGGAPVIQLVATTPAKSGSTHGSPFGSGAAAEGAQDVEGDCEEEGQQYYVVEEGSDDD